MKNLVTADDFRELAKKKGLFLLHEELASFVNQKFNEFMIAEKFAPEPHKCEPSCTWQQIDKLSDTWTMTCTNKCHICQKSLEPTWKAGQRDGP